MNFDEYWKNINKEIDDMEYEYPFAKRAWDDSRKNLFKELEEEIMSGRLGKRELTRYILDNAK